MQLHIFLARTDISLTAFAKAIGVSTEALRRYRVGDRLPDWPIMIAIQVATKGVVTPNDFLPMARGRAKRAQAKERAAAKVAAE